MILDFQLFIKIYIYTVGIAIIIYFLRDLMLLLLDELISHCFSLKAYDLLRFPRIYVSLYKIVLLIRRFIQKYRLYWITRYRTDNDDEYKLLDHITEGSKISKHLKKFIRFMWISRFTVLTAVASICVYFYIQRINPIEIMPVNMLESYYQRSSDTLKKFSYEFLVLLPSIIIIVSIFLSRNYNSLRGKFKAAIRRSNQKHLDDIIDVHRKVNSELINIVLKGTNNLQLMLRKIVDEQYYITLIDERIKRISPYIQDIRNGQVIWQDEYNHFLHYNRHRDEDDHFLYNFEDIEDEMKNIKTILEDAKSRGLYNDMFKIRCLDGKLNRSVLWDFENESHMNGILFTKKEIKEMLDVSELVKNGYSDIQEEPPAKEKRDYYNRDIIEYRKQYIGSTKLYLTMGLEALVNLYEYIRTLDKYLVLRDNKVFENLEKVIGQDK